MMACARSQLLRKLEARGLYEPQKSEASLGNVWESYLKNKQKSLIFGQYFARAVGLEVGEIKIRNGS